MSKEKYNLDHLSGAWLEKGQWTTVGSHKVFFYDSNNDKPALCVLHGYPTSSFDYHKCLSYLEKHFRVVIHDHLGFGLSDKPQNYNYQLFQQTDLALMLWHKLGIKTAQVLGHDYGTSIVTELLARELNESLGDFQMQAVTLCNGSMHVELAELRLIQKLLLNRLTGPIIARLSSKKTLSRNLKNLFHDPTLINEEEIEAIWNMMVFNQGRRVLPKLTQYIRERYRYWQRWIGALQSTELPISVVWAKEDKVAIEKMAHLIFSETKNSRLEVLSDLGHFPMMENPQRWSDSVIKGIKEMSA